MVLSPHLPPLHRSQVRIDRSEYERLLLVASKYGKREMLRQRRTKLLHLTLYRKSMPASYPRGGRHRHHRGIVLIVRNV